MRSKHNSIVMAEESEDAERTPLERESEFFSL